MGTEDIPVGRQWDTIETMTELLELEDHVKRFVSHTMQSMSSPRTDMWGNHIDGQVEHPMGGFLGVIQACKAGVYQRYGEDMFKQGVLFDLQFQTEDVDDGRTPEA
jgi:hypothetical protein